MMKKEKNKAAQIGAVIGVFVAVFTAIGVQKTFFKKEVRKLLSAAAKEVNKDVPKRMDHYIRLDSAHVAADSTLQYNYTLILHEKSEINLDTVNKYIKSPILNNIKTSPEMKFFREYQITMNYHYRDKNGVFVFNYEVTPDLYNE